MRRDQADSLFCAGQPFLGCSYIPINYYFFLRAAATTRTRRRSVHILEWLFHKAERPTVPYENKNAFLFGSSLSNQTNLLLIELVFPVHVVNTDIN